MRIGHASISENKNSGRDGKAKPGDQTGKEVCIREFYKYPWKYLLRCKDKEKAETMAIACEVLCKNDCIGYDQSRRITLHNELKKLNYAYTKLTTPCACDCSSFMTVLAEIADIFPKYTSGNAPVTANMVKLFKETNQFEVLTEGINEEFNLKRGDILVGPPNTHTVMVLDNGVKPIQSRRVLKKGMRGEDVRMVQTILQKEGYLKDKADSIFGPKTDAAVRQFQREKGLTVDGCVGVKTYAMLEQYN